jgi:primase-polymerase (primpol)-like protein
MSVKAHAKSKAIPPDPARVPLELKERRQWLPWDYEWDEKKGKEVKLLIDPRHGWPARWSRRENWLSFDDAFDAYRRRKCAGVGFIFSSDDPFCGIDIDKCRDPATGKIKRYVAELLQQFKTYKEISPSGTGVKAFGIGTVPGNKINRMVPGFGKMEFYSSGQFFTVTGHRLPGSPATISPVPVEEFCRQVFGVGGTKDGGSQKPADERLTAAIQERAEKLGRVSDAAALRYFRNIYTEEYESLYVRGDLSGHGGDQSKADFALCRRLWTCGAADCEQVERLFDGSALAARGKWRNRPDYRGWTIKNAILKGVEDMAYGISDDDLREYYECFGDG